GGARALRVHPDRLLPLAAGAAPVAAPPHGARAGGLRPPRPRLVRRCTRGLGTALRQRAPRGTLRPQPGRRPRRRRRGPPEAVRLSPPLLREAPAGDRAPVDAARRPRALAGVARRRPSRSAPAVSRLLGRRAARRVHAGGMEAPLLPAAEPAGARPADRAA